MNGQLAVSHGGHWNAVILCDWLKRDLPSHKNVIYVEGGTSDQW